MNTNLSNVHPWQLSNLLFANKIYISEISLIDFIKGMNEDNAYKCYFESIREKYYNDCHDGLILNAIVRYISPTIFYITNKRLFYKNCHLLFYNDRIMCQGGCRYACNEGDDQPNVFINNIQQIAQSVLEIDNYIYSTDCIGRTISIEERYPYEHYKDREDIRSSFAEIVKQKGGVSGKDHGGHLVANNIGGLTEAINVIPMPKEFNCGGEWAKMETYINNLVKGTKPFEGTIKTIIKYKDISTHLPSSIIKQIYAKDGRCLNIFKFEKIYE